MPVRHRGGERQGNNQTGLRTQRHQDAAGMLGAASRGRSGDLQERHYAGEFADQRQVENRLTSCAGNAKGQGRHVWDVQQAGAQEPELRKRQLMCAEKSARRRCLRRPGSLDVPL